MLNALIVYAHPEPTSFSAALRDRAIAQLEADGYDVAVSDLYAMQWQPVLGPEEFSEPVNPDRFDPSVEQEAAFHADTYSPEVRAEQRKVEDADLIIFHFPIWWFSAPAIVKGWFERVLARGFAYSRGKKYSRGHFLGKRAMLAVTTGTAGTLYEPNGIDGDLHHVLWPIHNGLLAYCGFTVLPPFPVFAPGTMTEEERAGALDAYTERIADLDDLEPLFFHPFEDYDRTQRLLPGVVARSGVQWNPRAGQTFEEAASTYTPRHDGSLQGARRHQSYNKAVTDNHFTVRKWVKAEDLNQHGTLFGGRLLQWVDEEAAILSVTQLGTVHVTTRFMSAVEFLAPATTGDLLELDYRIERFGTTSLTLSCHVENAVTGQAILTLERIVFVALDTNGRAVPHGYTHPTRGTERVRVSEKA